MGPRGHLIAAACSVAVLTSCTTAAPAPPPQLSSTSESPRPPVATPMSAPLTAGASAPCEAAISGSRASGPLGLMAVLVDVCDTGSRDGVRSTALRAYPVGLASLTPLPGVRPISFQHHFVHALSPDGRTLAAILWPSGSGSAGGRLHLIDVATWTDTTTEVELDQGVMRIEHAADGLALYWLKATAFDAAHGMPRSYAVQRYDLRTRKVTELVRLPASFLPYDHRIVGDRLAVYGVPTTTDNVAESAPQVHLVDLTTASIAATATLSGIRAGQFKLEVDPDRYPFLSISPGIGWDLPQRRLFVVDAEADRISVVDLLTGSAKVPVTFRPPRASLVENLLRWLVPIAEAKMTSETGRVAVVSPDGTHLYVRGLRSEFVKRDGGWREQVTPLGLRVIETASMTEIARIDEPVEDLRLSEDGRQLSYITFRAEDSGQQWAKRTAYRLHVADVPSMRALTTIELGERSRTIAIAPDASAIYVATSPPGPQIRALSLPSGRVIGEITGSEHFIQLIPLWPSSAR